MSSFPTTSILSSHEPVVTTSLMVGDSRLILETLCPACQGDCLRTKKHCAACHNTGRLPTPEGTKLLNFFTRHQNPNVRGSHEPRAEPKPEAAAKDG